MADDVPSKGIWIGILSFDGTDMRPPLVDTSGHLQVDALSSALPAGAATQATLATVANRIGDTTNPSAGSVNKQLADILTAAQLIDDLRAALQDVATDELRAREILSHQQYFEAWKDFSADLPLAASTTATAQSVTSDECWVHEVVVYANDDANDPIVRIVLYDAGDTQKFLSLHTGTYQGWNIDASTVQRVFGVFFTDIDAVNHNIRYSLLFDPPFHFPDGLKIALRNDSSAADIDNALQAWVRYTKEY